ncbi:MAG: diguanylate cyclase [Chromatocurvus sp.]
MNSPSIEFYRDLLDGLPQQIAVIDESGSVDWVNKAWRDFSKENGGDEHTGVSANYLVACLNAARAGDESAAEVYRGLKQLMAGDAAEFSYEYPYTSPVDTKWFLVRARALRGSTSGQWIISRENITKRLISEGRFRKLAGTDSLTSLANREAFDFFLDAEIHRSERSAQPLSLIMLDIDCFKAYNDFYGHVGGDHCLRKVAFIIATTFNRPSDMVARYGGDEFAVVLPQTGLDGAVGKAIDLLQDIRDFEILNESAALGEHLTVSIGLVSVIPDRDLKLEDLIAKADHALYKSKESGRDTVTVYED